jgi:hypothetical protein
MNITAKTISDEQIRELRDRHLGTNNGDDDVVRVCHTALGLYEALTVESVQTARALCADAINARARGCQVFTRHNEFWTEVDGRYVGTTANPCVILSADESLRFSVDDDLRDECRRVAVAAGVDSDLVACHTIGGPVVGTINSRAKETK